MGVGGTHTTRQVAHREVGGKHIVRRWMVFWEVSGTRVVGRWMRMPCSLAGKGERVEMGGMRWCTRWTGRERPMRGLLQGTV